MTDKSTSKSDASNMSENKVVNRVIKFRGFSVENNKWVYGFYWSNKPFLDMRHYIRINGKESLQVVPESVGEFTGLMDKEGKEIYEGNVVKYPTGDPKRPYIEETVKFKEGAFYPVCMEPGFNFEIIG